MWPLSDTVPLQLAVIHVYTVSLAILRCYAVHLHCQQQFKCFAADIKRNNEVEV